MGPLGRYLAVYVACLVCAVLMATVVGYSLPHDFSTSDTKFVSALDYARRAALWTSIVAAVPLAAVAFGYSVRLWKPTPLVTL